MAGRASAANRGAYGRHHFQHGRSQGHPQQIWGFQISGTGTPLAGLNQPIGVRVVVIRAGSCMASQVQPITTTPVQATFYPATEPIAAVTRPLPIRGRASSNAGTFSQLGPQVYPLRGPVRIRPSLPPRGRVGSSPGAPVTVAANLTFLQRGYPIATVKRGLPPKGSTATMVAVALFYQGPPVYPLQGPVRTRPQPPPRGRTQSLAGTFTATGPFPAPVYPLQRPVAATVRHLPPRGRNYARFGTFQGTGPAVKPLQGPVKASIRILPPKGRTYSNQGVYNQLGPAVKPLQHPVMAARLRQRGGSARFTPAYVAPAVPVNRTVVYPLHGPVRPRIAPKPRAGYSQARYGQFTFVQLNPVVFTIGTPFTAWQLGRPFSDWKIPGQAPFSAWAVSRPASEWKTGAAYSDWLVSVPS